METDSAASHLNFRSNISDCSSCSVAPRSDILISATAIGNGIGVVWRKEKQFDVVFVDLEAQSDLKKKKIGMEQRQRVLQIGRAHV